MNKQQYNQRSRRRNHQQFKAHEFEIPSSNNQRTLPRTEVSQTSGDGIRTEIYYHVDKYRQGSSLEDRRRAEDDRMEMNRRVEDILRGDYPNAWDVCTG